MRPRETSSLTRRRERLSWTNPSSVHRAATARMLGHQSSHQRAIRPTTPAGQSSHDVARLMPVRSKASLDPRVAAHLPFATRRAPGDREVGPAGARREGCRSGSGPRRRRPTGARLGGCDKRGGRGPCRSRAAWPRRASRPGRVRLAEPAHGGKRPCFRNAGEGVMSTTPWRRLLPPKPGRRRRAQAGDLASASAAGQREAEA